MANKLKLFERRKRRVRAKLRRVGGGKPRLSVFRSNQNIYAQVIDDVQGVTLVAASTLDGDIKGKVSNGGRKDAAELVGKLIAERAQSKGIKQVVLDRGGYLFHGRVQTLADAARSSGLEF